MQDKIVPAQMLYKGKCDASLMQFAHVPRPLSA